MGDITSIASRRKPRVDPENMKLARLLWRLNMGIPADLRPRADDTAEMIAEHYCDEALEATRRGGAE